MAIYGISLEHKLAVHSMARQARQTPVVQAYLRGVFDVVQADVNRFHREMWSHMDVLAGFRQRFEEALGIYHRLPTWLLGFADRSTTWWLRPKQVVGLDEHLKLYRRRAISVDASAHARMRALLLRCSRAGNSPGQDVTTHPQVTRGPNTRKSVCHNRPAGLLRA
ncbi:hypothetical protein [Prescottella equi]|uniref:hypothetical protein n=1 Tax=Rhodococcus hoagii TaxID=43767 RepID=UPI0007CD5F75|nr:hypothetical protein [Prescottella equi]